MNEQETGMWQHLFYAEMIAQGKLKEMNKFRETPKCYFCMMKEES